MGQCEFALFALLCQDVAFKRMLSFDFTGACKLETLFGTGFCFFVSACFLLLIIISLYFQIRFIRESEDFFLLNTEHCDCLLLLRRDEHYHPLAFKFGHLFNFPEFFQITGKTKEQYFTLVFINNGAPFEENVSFQFRTFLPKAFSDLIQQAIKKESKEFNV